MARLNRRSLLWGLGGTAFVSAVGAYDPVALQPHRPSPRQFGNGQPVVDPASLEKPNLTIGFVPVNDCAPIIIAYEQGLFAKYGLNVTLSREASWGTARDGVIFGRLDASPVVSGAVTHARLGAEGAKPVPLCAALTLHRHGNAMTMNHDLWRAGVRPLREYGGNLSEFGQQLGRYFRGLPSEERIWAVVLSSSIYEYFVRYLMAAAGLDPLKEFRVAIVPPPQMVTNLRIGTMQGYMVAEPWNTRAIAAKVGFTFCQGHEIWQGHPDRVLAVLEPFIDRYPKTYRSLVKALIEACQYCSRPENRPAIARAILPRAYTGAVPRRCAIPPVLTPDTLARLPACATDFTGPGLMGNYNYGGFDGQKREVRSPATTLFFDLGPDLATLPGDHSTFLWQSQGLWLLSQAARWGQIPSLPANPEAIVRRAWRTDLYREIASELGVACPSDDYKVEPADRFIDRRPFDPSNLDGYLKGFDIRANRPQLFGQAVTPHGPSPSRENGEWRMENG